MFTKLTLCQLGACYETLCFHAFMWLRLHCVMWSWLWQD